MGTGGVAVRVGRDEEREGIEVRGGRGAAGPGAGLGVGLEVGGRG